MQSPRVPAHSFFSFPPLHISDLSSSSSSSSSTLSPSCYWLSPHSFIRILPLTLLDAASGQRACSGALEGSTQVPCQLSPYFTFSRLTLAYLLIPGCLKCASRVLPSHPPSPLACPPPPSYCHEDMSEAIWSWRLYYLGACVCFRVMILQGSIPQASSFCNEFSHLAFLITSPFEPFLEYWNLSVVDSRCYLEPKHIVGPAFLQSDDCSQDDDTNSNKKKLLTWHDQEYNEQLVSLYL